MILKKCFVLMVLCLLCPAVFGQTDFLSDELPSGKENELAPSATFTVTKTADTNDGVCDSDCSLREAVAAAAPGDTIVFASPLFDTAQTVQTNGQITINKNLTINGRGANLTTVRNIAAAGPTSRVFLINGGTTVNLSGLTITGGNVTSGVAATGCGPTNACGGGISSESTLTLTNSVVSSNAANGSDFAQGGGIFSRGTLTLVNSTVSGNTATTTGIFAAGGGIYCDDSAIIINSTVSGNSAVGNSFAQSGGINMNFGVLSIYNSTVTNNSVPNGSGGGGGVSTRVDQPMNAVNTIISGNRANANLDLASALSAASTNNLIGGNAGLLPLGNYGGTTPTHAILPTSPAVNAGNNCVLTQTCTGANPPSALTTDQRGRGRVGQVDIGAYEVVGLTVTKTADTNDGVCDADCSLREAIAAAVSGDSIQFASPLFDTAQTIQTNGQFVIDKTLIINGRGASLTTIQNIAPQDATSRVFLVEVTGNLTLSNATVTGGNTSPGNPGGGILNRNLLTLIGCQLRDNTTAFEGGGIATGAPFSSDSPTTLIINNTISGNRAIVGGAGMALKRGDATIINTTISSNQSTNFGGAGIADAARTTNIVNSTITQNSTNAGGGGLRVEGGTVTLRNSIVAQNTAVNNRPDIFLTSRGTVTSNGNNLIGNATDTGIAITWQVSDLQNQNPVLAPLGFYGGATMTHALLTGSPAINAGNNCVTNQTCASNNPPVFLTTDQRGAARVGNVDIGAFELNNSANGGTFRAALPDGRLNSPYNFTLVPSNETTNYAVTAGALPPGMNLTTALAPSAVVSLTGTPTTGGVFNFTVTATNGANTSVTDYSVNIVVPTAAGVSVSGRVLTSGGRGVTNAFVVITDSSGNVRSVRTGTFGYFHFDSVAAGQTYIVTVNSKRFSFTPQVVEINDDLADLNFIAGSE